MAVTPIITGHATRITLGGQDVGLSGWTVTDPVVTRSDFPGAPPLPLTSTGYDWKTTGEWAAPPDQEWCPTEAAFRRACLEHVAGAHLVYGDWLEERGRDADAAVARQGRLPQASWAERLREMINTAGRLGRTLEDVAGAMGGYVVPAQCMAGIMGVAAHHERRDRRRARKAQRRYQRQKRKQ